MANLITTHTTHTAHKVQAGSNTMKPMTPVNSPNSSILSDSSLSSSLLINSPSSSKSAKSINSPSLKQKLLAKAAQELSDKIPELTADGVDISVYSAEEIEQMSVAKIDQTLKKGINFRSTVNDPRMGSIKNTAFCETCEMTVVGCSGHPGHIVLREPIYHPLFFECVLKVLKSVCNSCGGLLFTKREIKEDTYGFMGLKKEARLDAIEKLSVKRRCIRELMPEQYIGASSKNEPAINDVVMGEVTSCMPNPKFLVKESKENNKVTFQIEDDDKNYILEIAEVHKILSQIDDQTAQILGFERKNNIIRSHPRNFIVSHILVMPLCNRPPAVSDKGTEQNHCLTDSYDKIVRLNNELHTTPTDSTDYQKIVRDIQREYNKMILKSKGQSIRGTPYKSIIDLTQAKAGLIRNTLMGKRTNFTARAIIGPGPELQFGEIGIPEQIAKQLTLPELVTKDNINVLKKLIKDGRVERVITKKGQLIPLSATSSYNIQVGDTIARYMQDGDYVIINRQPTLHKQGMMSARVKIINDIIIRLHMSYTTPYNADFDGDEMNIHFPQTKEAVEEIKTITNVKNCIMNAQNNMPSMGLVFDSLLIYLMTQDNAKINQNTWTACLNMMTSKNQLKSLESRLKKHKVDMYSGRALFSGLLPPDFYYVKDGITITDGVLIKGYITKKQVGISSDSMIIELSKRYGRERTVSFLTDASWIVNRYLLQRGFTIGMKDCSPLNYLLQEEIRRNVIEARDFAESLHTNTEDISEVGRHERAILNKIDRATKIGDRIMESNIGKENNILVAATSGAKGSKANLSWITTSLGQQYLFGDRLRPGLSGGTRCLPHFKEEDKDPVARGYCYNSFSSGLSPLELYFHQTAGREGLIDTAIKTAEIGYCHRRITKMLEDLVVAEDGSVRSANHDIIQFAYGDDGLDAGKLQNIKNNNNESMATIINLNQVVGAINAQYGK